LLVIGTTFANRYEILDQLGEGASADVWKANDTHQNQLVALKLFRPGLSTIHAYGEATVLTALEGPSILRVYNADTFGDIPYIATRIAGMGTAEAFVAVNPLGLPADTVVSWMRQALVGLGACHDRRLVHRDIKPANIFLDTPEFALLGDFGLAYQLDLDGTSPAEGSPHTIAPEMWATGRGSVASDIYSMGVSTYRLLIGKWPFDATTREEISALVQAGDYTRLRDVAPHVSRRLAERVEKAMALDPASRYSTWREMHAELGRSGVVSRVWRQHRPHPGHDRCWVETSRLSGLPHDVCVLPKDARHVDIEVRCASGAKRRVARMCRARVETTRLAVTLRDVFDHF
jgi:serine/threonine-protein kinase